MLGVRLITTLIDGIVKTLPRIGSSLVSGLHSALNRARSIKWVSIGINIISGIISGVRRAGGRLITSILSVARNAYNAVKNFFGIESPSKLMRDKIGQMIPAGTALGIKDNEKLVTQAINEMDDKIVEPFDEGTGFVAYDDEPELETETVMDVLKSGSGNVMGANTQPQRDMTVILQLDKMQLAKTIYKLNNEETQRVGATLIGGLV